MRSLKIGEDPVKTIHKKAIIHVSNLECEKISGNSEGKEISALEQVLKFYRYRTLGLLSAEDVFVADADLKSQVDDLLRYQRRLNMTTLGLDQIAYIPNSEIPYDKQIKTGISYIRNHINKLNFPPRILFPFIQSKLTDEIALELDLETHCDAEASNKANNKAYVLKELEKRGVKVPEGYSVYSPKETTLAFSRLKEKGADLVFAKLGRAASGQGVFPISTISDLNKFMDLEAYQNEIFTEGVRLDKEVKATVFPNIMLYVDKKKKGDIKLASSVQLLDKRDENDASATVHRGNIGPLDTKYSKKVNVVISKIADFLREIKAYGVCGIDLMIEEKANNDFEVYTLEVNFRVNGNTAAAFMANKLSYTHWAANNKVKVPKNTDLNSYLLYLEKNKINYSPAKKSGVFVLNNCVAKDGYMQVGIVGQNQNEIRQLLDTCAMF